ncbi:MAG: enoyl-CoA hydratase-related protein [Bacteroidales bacterium]
MTYSNIEITSEKNTAFLRLNRPEVGNAINRDMAAEIIDALETLDKHASVRFIVIEGNGKNFCTGADLIWMKNAAEAPYDKNLEDSLLLAKCFHKLYSTEKISIAKVIGNVYGGGVGLIAACDFAYAETNSIFSFSEVKLGLVPSLIMPYVLQKTGIPVLRELMLTGRLISGVEALKIGLVNNCFDKKDQLSAEIANLISSLAEAAPLAQVEIKKLLNRYSIINTNSMLMHYTAELLAKTRAGAEAKEGIRAFLQRKSPG